MKYYKVLFTKRITEYKIYETTFKAWFKSSLLALRKKLKINNYQDNM